MAILNNFADFPEDDNEYADFITHYYGTAKAVPQEEIFPYEVFIYSDQPGVLRTER